MNFYQNQQVSQLYRKTARREWL